MLILAFSGQNLDQMLSNLQSARYAWVFLSLFTLLIAHILRAYRWNLMIESLGYGRPKLFNTFHAVIIGYLANLALPRMGELSRCGVINKTNGIPIVKLLGTVLAERLADLLMLGMVVSLAIIFQFKFLSGFLYHNILIKLEGRTGDLALLFLALMLLVLALAFFFILLKQKKWGLSKHIFKLIYGMKSGIVSVKNMKNKIGFVISSVLIWILYGLATYWCFLALDVTSHLGFGAAISVLVFSSLAMIAPIQGGIGAYHWMVSEGLTVYGIQRSEGLAYALLSHTSQTLIILFIGSLSLISLFMQKNPKNE